MIISHRHRFICFHNPKTAGISLRAVLAPFHDDPIPLRGMYSVPQFDYFFDSSHLRLWEIKQLFPRVISDARNYRSLVLVRDPWTRFVSALDQWLKTYSLDARFQGMSHERQIFAVESFVQVALSPETVRESHKFVHFSPQVWFIQDGRLTVPRHIVPMDSEGAFPARVLECLGLPGMRVPHVNRSRLDLAHVLGSPTVTSFIESFYAADFAFFAADRSLAHLAAAMPQAAVPALDGMDFAPVLTRRSQTGQVHRASASA